MKVQVLPQGLEREAQLEKGEVVLVTNPADATFKAWGKVEGYRPGSLGESALVWVGGLLFSLPVDHLTRAPQVIQ